MMSRSSYQQNSRCMIFPLHLWRRNEASLISLFSDMRYAGRKSPLAGGGGDVNNSRVVTVSPAHVETLRIMLGSESARRDHLVLTTHWGPHPAIPIGKWRLPPSTLEDSPSGQLLAGAFPWQHGRSQSPPQITYYTHTSHVSHIYLIAGVLHINCSVPGESIYQALTLC